MDTTHSGRFKGLLFLAAGLVVGVVLAAVVLFSSAPWDARSAPPPATGKPVPEFNLRTLQGDEMKWGDLQGMPVVLNFWATWCVPCKSEMPLFERASSDLRGKAVFLAINDNEDPQQVTQFAQMLELNFPILLDPGGTITSRYYVQSFPTTFFIDGEGILRAQHIGELNEVTLYKYLEAAGLRP